MRLLLGIGGCLIAVLTVAFVWGFWPSSSASDRTTDLQTLEESLGRPFVLFVDGPVSEGFSTVLSELDAPVGAISDQVDARTLADLDVYVMVRDSWATYRKTQEHDLASLIRQNAEGRDAKTSVVWFEAVITPNKGDARDLLVILAAQNGLADVNDFCFAVSVYEIARYSGNGSAFVDATDGAGSGWKKCHAKGWHTVSDMAGNTGG